MVDNVATAELSDRARNKLTVALFIVSVASFFLLRKPKSVWPFQLDFGTHPHQTYRMELLMAGIDKWCRENLGAQLEEILTRAEYSQMVIVALAALGQDVHEYQAQDPHWNHPQSKAYKTELFKLFEDHRRTLEDRIAAYDAERTGPA